MISDAERKVGCLGFSGSGAVAGDGAEDERVAFGLGNVRVCTKVNYVWHTGHAFGFFHGGGGAGSNFTGRGGPGDCKGRVGQDGSVATSGEDWARGGQECSKVSEDGVVVVCFVAKGRGKEEAKVCNKPEVAEEELVE